MRKKRRMTWKVATLLMAGGYAGVVGVGKLAYRALLYPAPSRGLKSAPRGGELLRAQASDGEFVQVLWLPADDAAGVVVFFHGNAQTIADCVPIGRRLNLLGLGFAAVEYRGYGGSPARHPSEQGLYADAEGALEALRERGIAQDQLTLWGHSLGSGVAVEMAKRGRAARLVLTAPYTSIPAVASSWLPVLPMSAIIADRYDSLAKAPGVTAPTLIIHGMNDRVVPHAMGDALATALPNATLHSAQGVGHNDLFSVDGDALFRAIADHARAEVR